MLSAPSGPATSNPGRASSYNKHDQPGLTAAYSELVAAYGAARVADTLLARWLTDPDADVKWERLAHRLS